MYDDHLYVFPPSLSLSLSVCLSRSRCVCVCVRVCVCVCVLHANSCNTVFFYSFVLTTVIFLPSTSPFLSETFFVYPPSPPNPFSFSALFIGQPFGSPIPLTMPALTYIYMDTSASFYCPAAVTLTGCRDDIQVQQKLTSSFSVLV